jgi:hypothetical protein
MTESSHMTDVETAAPEGAAMPLPLANGADAHASRDEAGDGAGKTGLVIVARPHGAPPLQGPRRRPGIADRQREYVARLHHAFGRQLAQLEKRAKEERGQALEKDARSLGVLAKTLETLIELDRDGAKVGEPEPPDRDVEELDADLAARIEAWAAGGAET